MITTTASTTSTATTAASIMSTSTATTTSTATVSMHFATLPMSMMPMIQAPQAPSADALDRAISVGNARAREMQDQMLTSAFQLAFNMGEKSQLLKDEQIRLRSEIALQKRSIELLEAQYQEKWTAHMEAAKVRMHAISSKISEIVKSIEIKARIDRDIMENSGALHSIALIIYSVWRSSLHKWCLPIFNEWINFLDFHSKHTEARFARQSAAKGTQAQNIEVTPAEASTQMSAFPQLAPFVQEMLAQERKMATEKQELASLKQLQESQKQDYLSSIETWKNKGTFHRCLRYVDQLKGIMETYLTQEKTKILAYEKQYGRYTQEHPGIEEANRLKGLVCAIIPDIEQAMAWMKGVNA